MVWMINKYAFLARSTQCGLSMVMVMMTSMNSFIEAYFSSIFTASWSALASGSESGRQSSLGSKCQCGDCRFVASHDVSARRSLPRSIYVSLVVVYSAGACQRSGAER